MIDQSFIGDGNYFKTTMHAVQENLKQFHRDAYFNINHQLNSSY